MSKIKSKYFEGVEEDGVCLRVNRAKDSKDNYKISIHSIPTKEFENMAKILKRKIVVYENGSDIKPSRWFQMSKRVTIFEGESK